MLQNYQLLQYKGDNSGNYNIKATANYWQKSPHPKKAERGMKTTNKENQSCYGASWHPRPMWTQIMLTISCVHS